jgi:hypothetical protein
MFVEILPANQHITAFRLNTRLFREPIFGYFFSSVKPPMLPEIINLYAREGLGHRADPGSLYWSLEPVMGTLLAQRCRYSVEVKYSGKG